MTTPNNTVAGLAEKWRNNADRASAESASKSLIPEAICELRAEAMTFRQCANALEAALASPAPSAGVGVEDAMVERIIDRVSRENSADGMDGDSWDRLLVRAALQHPAAPSVSPAYDRELIAKMLDTYAYRIAGNPGTHGEHVVREQARLLCEADNAEAANVGTVSAPPSVYQCPNCGTGMEVDPTAKPSPSVAGDAGELPEPSKAAQETRKRIDAAGIHIRVGSDLHLAEMLLMELGTLQRQVAIGSRLATAEQPDTEGVPFCPRCGAHPDEQLGSAVQGGVSGHGPSTPCCSKNAIPGNNLSTRTTNATLQTAAAQRRPD